MRALVAVAMLAGCQEYEIHDPPVVPPAEPPGAEQGEFGAPPDWTDCFGGFVGVYSNLTVDHPDVEPPVGDPGPSDPLAVDWWDAVAFDAYDPSLDFGANWWPVDQGLAADPSYFAVRWMAWIRAWSDTDLQVVLGSSDDVWVFIDGEPVVARPGVQAFDPSTVSIPLASGQYPLEIRYAHRAGDSAFRFRVIGGDASICYPQF